MLDIISGVFDHFVFMEAGEKAGRDRDWLVEQRYRAVLEVLDGSPVGEVAVRYGVSRQSVYSWKARHAAAGIDGLREASRRPRTSPARLSAEVEALVCELRRAHRRWGARRIAFEVAQRGVAGAPSRATVHRVLVRNGMVVPQAQRHKRKYRRWARETPMALWQLDLVGGVYLVDGRECKLLSGIDDHSRYVVCAAVLAVPSARAVAEAFTAAMRIYGVPAEVLTDNGKQFTGRFTKPRPAEVLFERVCREHGITAKLTRPYSPTTTGKVERWHQTLRRELLDVAGPFADLPSAQAAITAWVHAYNHARPHQALDMATPASLFRPGTRPGPALPMPALQPADEPAQSAIPAGPVPVLIGARSAGAVEFDTVISASGVLAVIPAVQRIKMGPARAGQRAHVWADEFTVHVLIGGQLVKTVPSSLDAEDLATLKMRGAIPAGPPPAAPAPARAGALPGGTVIEVDRTVDANGLADLGGHRVKAGPELARRRVTLRLDGHLVHVISDGVLAKTLPSPVPAADRSTLRGARIAAATLPPPAPGPVSVQRKVPRDGVIMVTRQRLRVGATYAGKIVTVHVEDTHFRVTCDGAEISLHPRTAQRPVTRWKAKIHAPKPDRVSSIS
jgi:transposase InsO family protein